MSMHFDDRRQEGDPGNIASYFSMRSDQVEIEPR